MGNIAKVCRPKQFRACLCMILSFCQQQQVPKGITAKNKNNTMTQCPWCQVLSCGFVATALAIFNSPWLSNTVISDILFSGGPIEPGYCMCYTIAPLPFQLFSRLRIGAMVDFAILNTSQEGSNFNVMFLVSSFPEHLTMLKIGISDQIFIHFHPCWSIDINFNPFSSIHFYPGLW